MAKAARLRGISSQRTYPISAQDRREVAVHFRNAVRVWQTRQADGADSIPISCLDKDPNLQRSYDDVLGEPNRARLSSW